MEVLVVVVLFCILVVLVGSCAEDAAPAFTKPPTSEYVEVFKYESTSRVGKVRLDGKDYYIWSDDVATGPVLVEVK